MMAWGEPHAPSGRTLDAGTTGQIEEAHDILDRAGVPEGMPLALRVVQLRRMYPGLFGVVEAAAPKPLA